MMSVSIPASLRRHRRPLMWAMILGLVMLPAIAMQFTSEVNWGLEDFAFAALLLVGAGLLTELAIFSLKTASARWIAGAVIVLGVMVIWAEAAVGLF